MEHTLSSQPTCLVTGAAGFIGSQTAEALIQRGCRVIGVDAFVDFYPRPFKEANLSDLRAAPSFQFIEADLRTADLQQLLRGVDYIFHLSAQAGVRTSWGTGFASYVEHNILATQRLLEAARQTRLSQAGVSRVIYASSSSVYGNAAVQPAREDSPTEPISPYGVTKLAAEHLCRLYTSEYGLPTISLRYFTVYGPRQRPDMAFHKFIRAIQTGQPIAVYGNGEQSRDFTYVGDIVEANIAAMQRGQAGAVYNIGGGNRVTINEVLHTMEAITGKRAVVNYETRQRGDAAHTAADTSAARRDLGYQPRYALEDGLRMEADWLTKQMATEFAG
jgi:nucleoside-diphosphate-sugar epimerase